MRYCFGTVNCNHNGTYNFRANDLFVLLGLIKEKDRITHSKHLLPKCKLITHYQIFIFNYCLTLNPIFIMKGNFLFRVKALFLLVIVFALWQCTQDDGALITSQQQIDDTSLVSNFQFVKITKDEFLQNTKASSQISKHFDKDKPKAGENLSNRAVESNGLIILDDEILFMGNDDNHTYTFKALSSQSESLLNVVLALQEDGSYEANLLVYNVTQEELEMYYNGEFVDFENRITYSPIDLEVDVIEILTNRSFSRSPCLIDFFFTNGDQNFTTLQACQNFGDGKCEFVPVWGQCPDDATDEIDDGGTDDTGGGSTGGNTDTNNNDTTNNNDNSTNGDGTNGDETDSSNTGGGGTGAGSGDTTTNDNTTNDNDNQADNQDADDTLGDDFETNPFGIGIATLTPEEILILEIKQHISLADNEEQFLFDNINIANEIKDRLEVSNGLEEQNYIREVIEAGLNETLVTAFPLLKYPEGSNYETLYPRLTQVLMEKIPAMAENELIVNAIHGITDAPVDVIIDALQWGNGPEVEIEQLGYTLGAPEIPEFEIYGRFKGHIFPDLANTLFLDIDLAQDLQDSEDGSCFSIAIELLIAVTLLHEYNHLGDFEFGEDFWYNLHLDSGDDSDEAGIVFEFEAFGEQLFRDNIQVYVLNNGLCD